MSLQRRLWRVERLGWGALVLLVLLTVLGLFSKGPLSEAEVASADADLRVRFERFERNGAASELVVHARSGADGKVVLGIDGDFLRSFTVESLQPPPLSSRSRGEGAEYLFAADDQGWVTAHFSLRAQRFGVSHSSVSAAGDTLPIAQFIYP
jgi:hypothetical protein